MTFQVYSFELVVHLDNKTPPEIPLFTLLNSPVEASGKRSVAERAGDGQIQALNRYRCKNYS